MLRGGWHALNVFVSKCPDTRQSEIFTEFPLKDSFHFLMVSDVSLEMQSDSKNYVGLQDDKITEPVHTIKSACA